MVSLDPSKILFRFREMASSLSSQNKRHGNTFGGLDDNQTMDELMVTRCQREPVFVVLGNAKPLAGFRLPGPIAAAPLEMTIPVTSPMLNG